MTQILSTADLEELRENAQTAHAKGCEHVGLTTDFMFALFEWIDAHAAAHRATSDALFDLRKKCNWGPDDAGPNIFDQHSALLASHRALQERVREADQSTVSARELASKFVHLYEVYCARAEAAEERVEALEKALLIARPYVMGRLRDLERGSRDYTAIADTKTDLADVEAALSKESQP